MKETNTHRFKTFIYLIGGLLATLAIIGCSETQGGPELKSLLSDEAAESVSDEEVKDSTTSSNENTEDPTPDDVISSAVEGESSTLSQSSNQNTDLSSVIGGDKSIESNTSSETECMVNVVSGAPEYSETAIYVAGDRVMQSVTIYECTAGVTVPWCNNPAYEPAGQYGSDAWTVVTEIENTATCTDGTVQSSSTSQMSSDGSGSGSVNESSPTMTGWTPFTPKESAHSIIGYYASWQWYDRSKKAAPENLDFSKWTRVNYAFFHPADDGTLHVTDDWADPQVLFGPTNWNPSTDDSEICISSMSKGGTSGSETCGYYDRANGLIELAHAAGTEVWPSIGGWTLSDKFPAIAASPTARASFASECVRLLREYNMDGIDIDWEYPGYTAHNGTDADKANYVLFMKEIKDSILAYGETRTPKRAYGITAALPCGTSILEKGIDIAALVDILDEFNLMTYDFHGAFEDKVDHNSPLYATNIYPETPRFSVDGCVQNYMERGAPAEMLNVGAGFYGRSFAGATDLGGTHSGNDAAHWATDEGMPMYYNIVTALAGGTLTKHFDDVAKVPYGIFTGGGIVSYEDEESMAIKAQYINDKSLRGVIVWEMSGDVMEDGTTPLSDVLDSQLSR